MKIVKLYADWCGPCRVLEKTMQDLDIKHENINIDSVDGEGLSVKYGIRAIPAILIFDDEDNLLRKLVGLPGSPEELTKFIYATN